MNSIMKAIAVFRGPIINGTIRFLELQDKVEMHIDLTGLTPNKYQGFHIHECGDLSDGCKSACAHYNPFNKNHGCRGMSERHVGDLGNIQADLFGNAKYTASDNVIRLSGDYSIIGRSVVIHSETDDCGSLGTEESLKTGNSGERIACAVIGYAKK